MTKTVALTQLAFDFGAGSGRAVVGRFDGSRLATEELHRFANEPVQLPGGLYWDILRLFHELKQGLVKYRQKGDSDLAGIGIDTWGVDFGLLDRQGILLGNPYHYRDPRTAGRIEMACAKAGRERIYQTTGIAFHPFNTLYQLLALQQQQPGLLEQATDLLLIPDLLNYFLTGEKRGEATIASTSQLLDLQSGAWAVELVQSLGLPTAILPRLIQPGSRLGKLRAELAAELQLGPVPVYAVAEHDTASAVAAVPADGTEFAYLSSGTWSLLGVETTDRHIRPQTLELNYTHETGVNGTVRMLKNIMGLWIYQECIREWALSGESHSFDELETMAEAAPAFQCLINPDDPRFFSPGGMPEKIRAFCRETGQPAPEGKGGLLRCILESLALKYRQVLRELELLLGRPIPVLHIVGGGCQNRMLNRFTADATGCTVVAGPVEATAIGNLLCQLLASGELQDLNQGRQLVRASFPTREYQPGPGQCWDEAFERFGRLGSDRGGEVG